MKKLFVYLAFISLSCLISCGGNENQSSEEIMEDAQSEAEESMDEIRDVVGSGSVLSNADIDRYIESFKPMSEEFEALGKNMNTTYSDPTLQEVFASKEVIDIAEKYGWDEDFGQKFMAISIGTSYLTMEEQVDQLPDDQKDAYMDMIGTQYEEYKNLIHEDDLELLRDRYEDIMVFIASME